MITTGFSRPRVVVSRCLEFDHCRLNGNVISSDIVKGMKGEVDFVPVCGELGMELTYSCRIRNYWESER